MRSRESRPSRFFGLKAWRTTGGGGGRPGGGAGFVRQANSTGALRQWGAIAHPLVGRRYRREARGEQARRGADDGEGGKLTEI